MKRATYGDRARSGTTTIRVSRTTRDLVNGLLKHREIRRDVYQADGHMASWRDYQVYGANADAVIYAAVLAFAAQYEPPAVPVPANDGERVAVQDAGEGAEVL